MPKPLRYFFIVLALFGLAFAIWTGVPRHRHAAEESAAPQAAGPEITTETNTIRSYTEQPVERTETAPDARASIPDGAHVNPAPGLVPDQARKVEFAKLTARFVDALGTPWPDVDVLDPDDPKVATKSDASGRFTLDVPQPWTEASWSGELVARRAGCATKLLRCTLTVATTTQLGDVVLGPGVDVYGRAIDEKRRGIKAKVGVAAGEHEVVDDGPTRRGGASHFDRALAVDSAEDGSFVLRGVAPGEWRLWAQGDGSRYGWTDKFTLVEGADARGLEVVVPALRDSDLITGIVLAPDGSPVPGATLAYSFATETMSSSTTRQADDDGRFRIVIDDDQAPFDITAGDPQGRYSEATANGVKPGTLEIELRLGENAPFYLVLRGPEGEPVDDCRLALHRQLREGHWQGTTTEWKSKGEGRFEFVAPSSRFRIEIEAKGYRKHQTEELDPPVPGSTLEITLDRTPFLRGRVLADGKPASGAKVRGFKDVGDSLLEVNGFRCLHHAWGDAETTTKDDGTFELPYNDDTLLWIRAELSGFAAAELGPIAPASSPALAFELVRGGLIEGIVILPDGKDAEGTIVGISRCDGFPRTQRAGAGGRFRFEGLTPGNWQVLHRTQEIDPDSTSSTMSTGSKPIEWSCEVRDGRTTRFDLDLSRP
ncbi:MAG: hypothetical protein HUU28_00955 [Planctomycetaceae bacterium]|nr:hypothetical protein [Planctomycetaceae bacterium]